MKMDVLEEFFPSKHLKAADLDGKEIMVTINRVEREKVGDDMKAVIYFNGKQKGVALNKGNTKILAESFGRDSGGWIGQQVILLSVWTEYQNKPVQGLRVRIPPAEPAAPRGPAPYQVRENDPISSGPQRVVTPGNQGMDDDIPF